MKIIESMKKKSIFVIIKINNLQTDKLCYNVS